MSSFAHDLYTIQEALGDRLNQNKRLVREQLTKFLTLRERSQTLHIVFSKFY
jgi:hypothetical protein